MFNYKKVSKNVAYHIYVHESTLTRDKKDPVSVDWISVQSAA